MHALLLTRLIPSPHLVRQLRHEVLVLADLLPGLAQVVDRVDQGRLDHHLSVNWLPRGEQRPGVELAAQGGGLQFEFWVQVSGPPLTQQSA